MMKESTAMIYFKIQVFGFKFQQFGICILLGLWTLIGLKLESFLMDFCLTQLCHGPKCFILLFTYFPPTQKKKKKNPHAVCKAANFDTARENDTKKQVLDLGLSGSSLNPVIFTLQT
jgi:hypothetical protein